MAVIAALSNATERERRMRHQKNIRERTVSYIEVENGDKFSINYQSNRYSKKKKKREVSNVIAKIITAHSSVSTSGR